MVAPVALVPLALASNPETPAGLPFLGTSLTYFVWVTLHHEARVSERASEEASTKFSTKPSLLPLRVRLVWPAEAKRLFVARWVIMGCFMDVCFNRFVCPVSRPA